MKILVVDDEAVAREAASQTLCRFGYDVMTASNGYEALDVLRQGGCQLVITDWEMPEMDGLSLCRAIREEGFRGYMHVIMLTSHRDPENTIEGLAAGADDYVTKPFNPAELVMRVNTGRRIIGLETRDVAIFAMAKLAESRDPETGAHLERVRKYCRCLAIELRRNPEFQGEIDDDFIRLIYETSPLHDIGKVAVPDHVLLKPGQLTDREFEVMKSHTLEGARTLQAALDEYPHARFLRMARNIALTHHEKFDGSGYPQGLRGRQIPLCGRIVAIADVYDALTSRRVYKSEFAHDVARSIIMKGAGNHFDPAIVEAFTIVEAQFLEIRRGYEDPKDGIAVAEFLKAHHATTLEPLQAR